MMTRASPLLAAVAFLFSVLPGLGQIYAEFTVSHGGTQLGKFLARLDYDKAPRTCANFIGLATGQRVWIDVTNGALKTNAPYYDGLTFHRLIHNFMIQGGSPNGQGTDGPGFVIQDEFHADLRHSGRYLLSMAKSSLPNTGGSQFFITLEAASHLDDKHSVFGEVIDGTGIIDGFANSVDFPTTAADKPLQPIVMESVTIRGPDLANFDIGAPGLRLPQVSGQASVPSYDAGAGAYTVAFDRQFQREYFYLYSLDLSSWTPFRYILSNEAESQWPFTLTEVTFNTFFSRLAAIDYSFLPNPPADLMPSGATVLVRDRSGNSLTLVSDGAGGGSWSDSAGGSGNITDLVTIDGAGDAGIDAYTSSNAHLFSLARIQASLDGSTAIHGHSNYDLILSFHTASAGWVDGTASGGTNAVSTRILQEFSLSGP